MRQHAAVVLAAGGSRRLGRPKQLLRRDGETLVRRAVRLASATSPARLLVVVGGEGSAVEDELQACACEIIRNTSWQEGIASSLRAVSRALPGVDLPILVLGCDQPALEHRHLAALLLGASQSRSGIAATLHAGAAGIPAVVPATWFAGFKGTGDHGFGSQLRALPAESLFLLKEDALEQDLDTPGDIAAAITLGWVDAS